MDPDIIMAFNRECLLRLRVLYHVLGWGVYWHESRFISQNLGRSLTLEWLKNIHELKLRGRFDRLVESGFSSLEVRRTISGAMLSTLFDLRPASAIHH